MLADPRPLSGASAPRLERDWPIRMGRAMEPVTPQDLFERYCALSDDDRIDFLHLVGGISTATHPLTIVSHLSESERLRYTRLLHDSMIADFEPVMLQAARDTAKAMPEAADADFDRALRVRLEQSLVRVADHMRALADEELKRSR